MLEKQIQTFVVGQRFYEDFVFFWVDQRWTACKRAGPSLQFCWIQSMEGVVGTDLQADRQCEMHDSAEPINCFSKPKAPVEVIVL